MNVEAYDYYGPWDKRTGIIAPLMKMDEQYLTEAFMNIVRNLLKKRLKAAQVSDLSLRLVARTEQ